MVKPKMYMRWRVPCHVMFYLINNEMVGEKSACSLQTLPDSDDAFIRKFDELFIRSRKDPLPVDGRQLQTTISSILVDILYTVCTFPFQLNGTHMSALRLASTDSVADDASPATLIGGWRTPKSRHQHLAALHFRFETRATGWARRERCDYWLTRDRFQFVISFYRPALMQFLLSV